MTWDASCVTCDMYRVVCLIVVQDWCWSVRSEALVLAMQLLNVCDVAFETLLCNCSLTAAFDRSANFCLIKMRRKRMRVRDHDTLETM